MIYSKYGSGIYLEGRRKITGNPFQDIGRPSRDSK
jgi:hypothetical protein